MLILGQDRMTLVNLNCTDTISIRNNGDKGHAIVGWISGNYNDCTCIGIYKTKERCKEIIREIFERYGQYLHRPHSQAILRGSVDIPEMIAVLPKTYEMPEE